MEMPGCGERGKKTKGFPLRPPPLIPAAAGLAVGAIAATTAIFAGIVLEPAARSLDALLTQPAVLSVPLAFAAMVLVSIAQSGTRRTPTAELLALHAPEGLGLGLEDEDVGAVRA